MEVAILRRHRDGAEALLRFIQQVEVERSLNEPQADVVAFRSQLVCLGQMGIGDAGLLVSQCLLPLGQQLFLFFGGEGGEILAQGGFILRSFDDPLFVRATLMEQHQRRQGAQAELAGQRLQLGIVHIHLGQGDLLIGGPNQ